MLTFEAVHRGSDRPAIADRAAHQTASTKDDRVADGGVYLAAARANAAGAEYGLRDCAVDVDTVESPASDKKYLAAINGVCYAATAAVDRLSKPPHTAAGFHRYVTNFMPILAALIRDLKAQPPAADSKPGELDQMIKLWEQATTDLQAADDAVQSGDTTTANKSLKAFLRQEPVIDAEARSLKLPQCVSATV